MCFENLSPLEEEYDCFYSTFIVYWAGLCVCVCVFIKLHITAQSGLVILCHSR